MNNAVIRLAAGSMGQVNPAMDIVESSWKHIDKA